MRKNTKHAFWILIAILVGAYLVMFYALGTGKIVLTLVVCAGVLTFCCYGAYLSIAKKKNDAEELRTTQNRIQDEYRSALAPFYTDMRKNYYTLFNSLKIPADAAMIDVETTVFGLQCEAKPTAGQVACYQKDFYMWKDGDAILIFPTEAHLSDSHIKYRTRTKDLAARLNPADIKIFKVNIADVEYFLTTGKETSEFRIEGGGSTGPNIKGAIIGGILAGDAGAIIGGAPEAKPIYAYTQYNENRYVELVYREYGIVQKIKLSYPAFPFLELWMPEKEYSYVIARGTANG